MAQQLDLAQLFGSIAQELQTDRTHLNSLDSRNGNAGDNMANNFQIVSDVLAQQRGKQDGRDALLTAADVLQEQGRGRTASLYAGGLKQAASNLPQGTLTIDDLLPLLEGLLGGVQKSSGAQQGDGTLLDALIPGVLGYMQAKRQGSSEIEAILNALAASRRGTYGGYSQQPSTPAPQPSDGGLGGLLGSLGGLLGGATQQPSQVPQQSTPQIDPGAAGVSSLLEGLFRGILQSGILDGGSSATPSNDPTPTPDSTDPTPTPDSNAPSGEHRKYV